MGRVELDHIPRGQRFVAGLVVYALVIPYVAAVITVVAYLSPLTLPSWMRVVAPDNAFVLGSLLAAAIWLVLSAITVRNRFAAADGPDPARYAELASRLNLLHSNLTTLSSSPSGMSRRELAAYENATTEKNAAGRALRETGLQWVRGTGYLDVLQRLHHAEEEMIQAQTKAEVIGGALEDHLRLHGCEIANRDELMRDLRFAVFAIKSGMTPYFIDEPETPVSDPAAHATTLKHKYPRAALKTIRRTINDYRDEQRFGLLQVRNRLLVTAMVTEITALLVLGLAVTGGAHEAQIKAGSAFFLVGALLGLLYNRLRTAMEATSTTGEDYGASMARLWATPLFSGLAAIGGVLLVAVLPHFLDVDVSSVSESTNAESVARETAVPHRALISDQLSNTASGQAQTDDANAATDPDGQPPGLEDIFDLKSLSLVIAAFFGLSPAYFFDRLRQADKLLANLRSTEPANRANA